MTNEVVIHGDDGFGGSFTAGRLIKGSILRWNETAGWIDRDGLHPPEDLLALACTEALQCWKDRRPVETITTKPLPDVDELNATVPREEWEPGLDGRPKPPWVQQVIVYLIDPATAAFYTYLNSTVGARIAYDLLRERVVTMRALRGAKVVPLVKLSHVPMKTTFGMKRRPDFKIIDWRNLGGSGAPALTGPQASSTLAAMGKVSVPSAAEEMADKVPW
jgi:hypothetical protein